MSSFYSQPSPNAVLNPEPREAEPRTFDVSPPSSPEPDLHLQEQAGQPRRFRSMRDVSPVDESRGQLTPSPRGVSNIPVMRKAAPGAPGIRGRESAATQKFWGGKVAPNSKVRWDEYSGEPTSSNAGKAAQVSPGSYSKSGTPPPSARLRETGYDVTVTAQHGKSRRNQSLAERANRYGTKPVPVETKPREPWSLASGRAEIVKPFKDKLSDKPLNFVRKTERGFEGKPSNSPATPVARVPDTASVAEVRDQVDMPEESIKPVVPLKVAGTSPPRAVASPTSPHTPGTFNPYSYPSPVTPTNKDPPIATAIAGNISQLEPAQSQPTTPNTTVPRKSSEGTPRSAGSKNNGPTSRFSWTTYNSGTTYQQSPPPSPPPALPISKTPAQPIPAASSILNRKRPVPGADRIPSRKPIAVSAASSVRNTMNSGPPSPRPESTFSTSTHKALPRPPTEIAAVDHIELLESQIEDLRVRRNNVYRLLNDLNNMAPPNPMITDFKRMRLVEQRKKDFEDELAGIKRQEHEVGLKLHRALRKREAADPNGSESAIWVRRVTR